MPKKKKATSISIILKSNEWPYSTLIEQLVSHTYKRVSLCTIPGEFSVRGSIVDIFGINQSHPIRLEYFDDTIERLTSFDVHTQRSIRQLTECHIEPITTNSIQHYNLATASTPADISLLSEFHVNDFVVHEDHGIGQFKGLIRLKLTQLEGEYLFIQYKGDDKIYVPLDQLNRLTRYTGSELSPPLHSLSSGSWKRTKTKIKKALLTIAEDVFMNAKRRQTIQGFACAHDSVYQIELENEFEHTETPDQIKTIDAIKTDMQSEKPMDRLVCGDVGYGKTEMIIRATFKAVDNLKQIAILVPTTLLAEQHYKQFKKRFSQFPYTIELLSRFRPKKDQTRIIHELKKGTVDIIIGTHRLIQPDIQFADLGLLIIDEEQRFGVSHKESIKTKYPHVDTLSVSATPIPRTLYMTLTGGKQISTIETPPPNRKPVLTALDHYSSSKIKSIIKHELDRQGQVFYVLNDIDKMAAKQHELQQLIPTASIDIIHSKMTDTKLETVMKQFIDKDIDILISTTIIENGIDIPNANTLIIDRAHRFGLSQIHQLRGRVGRSSNQGYCYLFYEKDSVTEKGQQRLDAIKEYTSLGSGYQLAIKDLEIRGAGTLLGQKQHGHMTAIGFNLYCKLLNETMGKPTTQFLPPTFNAYIPDSYIENQREKIAIYQRINHLLSIDELDDLKDELQDRYGPFPELVDTLWDGLEDSLLNR